jgi:hypothetical protein
MMDVDQAAKAMKDAEIEAEIEIRTKEVRRTTRPISRTIHLRLATLRPLGRSIVDPNWHASGASGSMPLARPHGAALSAISRTSTPRSLARINAPTIPEPTVRR